MYRFFFGGASPISPFHAVHFSWSFSSLCFANFFEQPEHRISPLEDLFAHCDSRKIFERKPPNFRPDSRPSQSSLSASTMSSLASLTPTRAWQKSSSSSTGGGMSGREERSAAGRSSEAAGATLAVAAFLEAATEGRRDAMATRSSSLAVASMARNSLAEKLAIADISGFLA